MHAKHQKDTILLQETKKKANRFKLSCFELEIQTNSEEKKCHASESYLTPVGILGHTNLGANDSRVIT